jgi:hypothetical protein
VISAKKYVENIILRFLPKACGELQKYLSLRVGKSLGRIILIFYEKAVTLQHKM